MGNSLRCCLACVLPCGALDVIRIVHLSGYVEEITRPITAGEILKANPNHVLSTPCSQGVARQILILSPESELKRGSIYFLIPTSSLPEKKKKKNNNSSSSHNDNKKPTRKSKKCNNSSNNGPEDCERYLEEVVSKKKSTSRKGRRSDQIGVWQPHLHSISED